MALILPPGAKIRGVVLTMGYAKIDSATVSGGRAIAAISIYADKVERKAGTPPIDIITIVSPSQSLPRGLGPAASVVGDFYTLIKLAPALVGSTDDLVELE